MFITFEGGEGSGKSTIIQAVASTLAQRATSYLVTREPGGTRMGELIRQLILNVDHGEITPRTEALL
jgi:dTMP kinase